MLKHRISKKPLKSIRKVQDSGKDLDFSVIF